MFNKLREKLKSWTKVFSKKAEEKAEEKLEKIEEAPKNVKAISEEQIEKTETISEILENKTKEEIKPIEEHEYKEAEKREEIPEERELGKKVWGDIKQEEKSREKEEKKKGFFQKILSKITKTKISEEDFNAYAEELKIIFLENNVAFEVVEKIIERLKTEIVGKEISKKEIEPEINKSLKRIILDILIEPFDVAEDIKEFRKQNPSKPYVILFCGINGSGKTTTIAKIAYFLKLNKISAVLAAGDTFRAASIEQIKKHGEKLKIEVIAHKYESDPASVGFDAIKHAEKKHIDCVLIDTAGRMHTAKNLMAQIEKISKVCKPNLKIFIGESITGNDAVEQAKSFDSAVGINGIILTKADVDEKGGTALSVGYITGRPILYLGTGQEYSDLEEFDKNKFLEKLGL